MRITSGGCRGRRNRRPPPPQKKKIKKIKKKNQKKKNQKKKIKKKKSTVCVLIPFCIRMLKNKAQIARESMKNPESFQDP